MAISYFKKRILAQGAAAARNKPEEYIMYFEDLFQAPNAEIGSISLRSSSYARQKDFFEMAYSNRCQPLQPQRKMTCHEHGYIDRTAKRCIKR
jgi:hypothetical protein